MPIIPNTESKEFVYDLPEDRIAQYPLADRSSSRLLVYKDGNIQEGVFNQIGEHLPSTALLVFNETRVIQARLRFKKGTGAVIEIFCLEPHIPSDYALSLGTQEFCSWKCLVGNSKRWKSGILTMSLIIRNMHINLHAERLENDGESSFIKFSWDEASVSFAEILETAGEVPLPPYLNRPAEESDKGRYQTVYARQDGSVAAPTAGLHFTQGILDNLSARGVQSARLCLHVGAGTFKPVQARLISEHEMHNEHFFVSRELVGKLLKHPGPIVAVGTTSVRTLESLYHLGRKLLMSQKSIGDFQIDQWSGMEESNYSRNECLQAILDQMEARGSGILEASTQIMIVPGYRFRMTDILITNFHQPGSTLLMLIAAFTGEDWKKIYAFALDHGFRFLSYGDSNLLFRTAD
ncbi:MAG: S-adenosylmethionine:tRNA ribosyltransferase-isomerase [Bacteroidales bacterium]